MVKREEIARRRIGNFAVHHDTTQWVVETMGTATNTKTGEVRDVVKSKSFYSSFDSVVKKLADSMLAVAWSDANTAIEQLTDGWEQDLRKGA